jgi:hypothetical protein
MWALQDKIALDPEEVAAIGLKREIVAGQEHVVWNPEAAPASVLASNIFACLTAAAKGAEADAVDNARQPECRRLLCESEKARCGNRAEQHVTSGQGRLRTA